MELVGTSSALRKIEGEVIDYFMLSFVLVRPIMFSSMKHKMHCANYKLGNAPGRVNKEMSRDIKKRGRKGCASADKRKKIKKVIRDDGSACSSKGNRKVQGDFETTDGSSNEMIDDEG